MWIFTNNAFFSIVEDRDNTDMVVVRARVQGDLQRAFGNDHEIIESEDSDYRFRAFLNREYVANTIKNNIMNIDYDNFKNSIAKDDKTRKSYYHDVWDVMNRWQEGVFGGSWISKYLSQKYGTGSYALDGGVQEEDEYETGTGYLKGFRYKKAKKKSKKQKMYEDLFDKTTAFDEYGAR